AAPTSAAPPTACTQRPAINVVTLSASPHASDAPTNATIPATNTGRGPIRRLTNAAGTAHAASARLKPVITHTIRSTDVSNVRSMSGRASTTTEESANTAATATVSSTTRGR